LQYKPSKRGASPINLADDGDWDGLKTKMIAELKKKQPYDWYIVVEEQVCFSLLSSLIVPDFL